MSDAAATGWAEEVLRQLPYPLFRLESDSAVPLNPAALNLAGACEEQDLPLPDYLRRHGRSHSWETGGARYLLLGHDRRQLRLGEQLRSFGELAGGVAHNLNNPLNALSGLIQLLTLRNPELGDLSKVDEQSEMLVQQIRCFAERYRRLVETAETAPPTWELILREEFNFYRAHMTVKHHCEVRFDLPEGTTAPLDYLDGSWLVGRMLQAVVAVMRDRGMHALTVDLHDGWPRLKIENALPEHLAQILPELSDRRLDELLEPQGLRLRWAFDQDGHFTIWLESGGADRVQHPVP